MWGLDQWGTMIWGGGVAVPTMPIGPLLGLMLGCFLAGGYLLHPARRNRRNAFVAAALLALPISVGAVTLPFTFTNGSIADANQVNANFTALASALAVPNCPSGMSRVELPFSILCHANAPTSTWTNSSDYCDAQFRARLCSLQQWRDLVCRAGVPSPGASWTDDITGTAAFGVVSGCTTDAISSSSAITQRAAICCLEWPRY